MLDVGHVYISCCSASRHTYTYWVKKTPRTGARKHARLSHCDVLKRVVIASAFMCVIVIAAYLSDFVTKKTKPLIIFTYPEAQTVLRTDRVETLTWKYADPSIPQTFADFDMYLQIFDAKGKSGGIIAIVHPDTTEVAWNITEMAKVYPSFYTGSEKFRIQAMLKYSGMAPFTCSYVKKSKECVPVYAEALQSKVIQARAYASESDPFSIVVSK